MKPQQYTLLTLCFLFSTLLFADCTTSRPEPRRLGEARPTVTLIPGSPPTPVITASDIQPPLLTVQPTLEAPVTASPLPPTAVPTANPPIRFAVIGDYGSAGPALADVANLTKSWNPDFILTVGDNNYPDGSAKTIDENIGQYFHEYIFPYQGQYGPGADTYRFYPSLGNHDWNTRGAQPYLDYFTLPGNERYYDFTWGPVHIFMIDSDSREPDGVSSKSVQALWLQERLAASTLPWKLVAFHHPPYSSGIHGSVEWMRWPFAEWGASAILAGHDHLYERLLIDGIPNFINGLGGGAIYRFENILDGSQVRYNDDYGAMLVTADESQITFQFYTRQGVLIDSYQITAGS